MPHLHDNGDAEEKVSDSRTAKLALQAGNVPHPPSVATIKEARQTSLSGSGRQVSASPDSATPSATVKVASFESPEEERTPEDTSSPRSHPPKQIITPSPYVMHRSTTPENRFGPMLSIYGNTRLFPSPIRVKKRTPNPESGSDRNSPSPQMIHPSNLRYAGAFTATPPPNRPELQRMLSMDSASSRSKRPVEHIVFDDAKKKTKLERTDSPGGSVDDDRGRGSPAQSVSSNKKVISPTSSGEKEDDDSTTAARSKPQPYGARPYMHGYSHPPFAAHHSYGAPPPYHGAYHHMYSNYPPPPHPYMAGHPPFYSPYPPHPHAMAAHYRPPHGKYAFPGNQIRAGAPKPMGMAPVTSGDAGEDTDPSGDKMQPQAAARTLGGSNTAIKSVSDWQNAALSTGKPPSAGRCLPLKEPIPSRYWGEAEKTKDVVLPDFHRLVNFPDYLAKSRNPSSSDSSSPPAGKKNCVMCGKLRVCSASSLVNRPKTKQEENETSLEDDDGTAHIIPRQNKGLCTACDVTVWVVVTDGLEIKWCKGCKNFRPWAAFGDKGSATKCVRCRDRQREKYAMQKDEIRLRRYKRSSSPNSSSSTGETDTAGDEGKRRGKWEEQHKDEDTHLAAARGLRNLMNAASV